MDNVEGFQDSALVVFGGLVAEANAPDVPAGSSPVCCDMDFTVASAKTRDGVVNVYVYDGFDQEFDAGSGVDIPISGGEAWANPSNIIHDTVGTYATATLNATPVAVAANNQQLSFHANGVTLAITEIADNSGNPGVWATLTISTPYSQLQVAGAGTIVVSGFTNPANNGTFNVVTVNSGTIIVDCPCVPEIHAATGVTNTGHGPSWTLTVTATGSPINVGDTAFLQINGRDPFGTPGTPTTIASVTDNLGNTWQPIAPIQSTQSGRGFLQMWYAVMGTAVALTDQFIVTANEDTSGNPVDMTVFGFQNFAGVGALLGFVQNSGTGAGPWSSGTLDPSQAAFLLSYSFAGSSISSGPTGFTVPQSSTWGSNGGNNSEAQYAAGGPGSVTDTGWTQGSSAEFDSTLAAFAVETASAGAFSHILEAATYGFTAPDSSEILGIELIVNGKQSRTSTVLSAVPIGGGEIINFALPATDGSFTSGGPNFFFGLDPTPDIVNNPGFGFDITAEDPSGMGATVQISGVDIKVWYSPPGLTQFDWIKTYEMQNGGIFTLALDNNGVGWQEDVNDNPGVLTPFYTAFEPDTFANSVTEDNREFIALSDLSMGTDMPRTYDGTNVDRLSQVGPAAAPTVSFTSTEYPIETITQPAPVTNGSTGNPIRALLWSSGPGVKNTAGNVITVEYTLSTVTPDPNIYVGGGVVLAGFRVISGNDPNGFYIVQSVQTTNTGNSTRNSFSVAAPASFNTYDDPPMGASYQSTLATLTTSEPVPNLGVGGSLIISDASVAGWDNTWTVLFTPNAGQYEITDTQLVSNQAIYAFSLISGSNPAVGDQVTITGCTNGAQPGGNSIFNVVNAIISAVGGSTFSIEIDAPDISGEAENASAIVSGTIFQFDPGPSAVGDSPSSPTFDPIIGNSTGGSLELAGNLGAGTRGCVVMFLTRNGLLTAPSPQAIFTLPESANSITVSGILSGPNNIVARVLAFTGAGGATIDGGGGFYFWIPTPVSVLDNGQTVVYTATIIPDNVTTAVTLTFTDAVLLAGDAISIQGSNNFAQIELGSCTGLISYGNRIFAIGEQNKVQNFNNLSFDGGFLNLNPASPLQPAGWTTDPVNGTGGLLVTSPLFGNAFEISNTSGSTQAIWGMITQTAYQDPNKVPIITPRTEYGARVTAATTATSGNLVVDLFSPTFNVSFGKFTIPLASLSGTMQIEIGDLLTTEFTVSVPNDLLLRIYATALPNNTSVTIDRVEVFDLSLPVLNTQMRASYYDNFEAFDGVTGNLGVGSQNQQPIFCGFELFDNLYIVKNKSLVSTTDNGVTEPSGWTIREVSNKCGTQTINGVALGEGWALIAGQPGVYVFEGGQPVKISPEIDPVWKTIRWKFGQTLWIRNDPDERKFYVGVPIPTPNQWMPNFPANPNPTTPNVVLMCNYKELMTGGALTSEGPLRVAYTGELKSYPLGRKWSAWSIEACYADFIRRDDTTEPIFFCPDTGVGRIYQQLAGNYADDGEAMRCKYVTYPFPKTSEAQSSAMGLHQLEAHLATLLIRGEGQLRPMLIPDNIDSPNAEALIPEPLFDPPSLGDMELPLNGTGNRFFVDLSVRDAGEWFEVSRIVMTLSKDPWAEVRGINA